MENNLLKAALAVVIVSLLAACNGARRHGGHHSEAAEAVAVASVAAVLTGIQMARQSDVDLRPRESECTHFCTGCTYPCGDHCVPYATLCADPPGTACMGGNADFTPQGSPPGLQSDCAGQWWGVAFTPE